MNALGYQQLTGLSAAQSLSPPAKAAAGSVPAINATIALIAVSGGSIRYRDDGTPPTASLGMPIAAGQAFQYVGNLAALQFIQVSAAATIDVLFYG